MKSRIDDELKWFMEQLSTLLSFLQSSTSRVALSTWLVFPMTGQFDYYVIMYIIYYLIYLYGLAFE